MARAFFRREVRPLFAYAAAVVFAVLGWVLSQSPAAAAFSQPYVPAEVVAFGTFLVAALVVAWIAHGAGRTRAGWAQAEALAARLDAEIRRRAALLELGERALAGGSLDALRSDAATLTAAAIGVEHGVVLDLTSARELTVLTAVGPDAAGLEGLTLAVDVDTQVGFALHARDPVVVTDADVHTRFEMPSMLRGRGARSGVAARVSGTTGPFGVLVVYSTSARSYEPDDVRCVSGMAGVLGGVCERKRLETERQELTARDKSHRAAAELAFKRAAFLAQTATVFDTALEPDATLVSLARLAVPALAECAMVDLVHEDGHVRRVEVVEIDPVRRDAAQGLRRQAPDIRSETPFSRAIRTGQPALLSRVHDREPEAAGVDPEHERLIRALQCESLLLIPLVARGQTLGLLTLASRERLYDAVDLSVAQDLSSRAAIALENARLYREAQAASRAKDEFLAMVSHELRTPLNAVLGWATILRECQLDEARTKHACDAIERSARAQARFLEQLLDVSRAISGKLELHIAAAEAAGILDAAIDAVRPGAQEKNVRIATQLDESIPALMVDPERLQQAIVNMLGNAVKFSPEGGVVEVELRRDERFVEIVVVDHGIGIKREFLPYVFDRFRQGGTGPGRANRGLGLGMAIARDIIERHGGTITADSDGEGRGATFKVRLPLRSAAEASNVAVPAIPPNRRNGAASYHTH
jgi:signal transduction histidine kinase